MTFRLLLGTALNARDCPNTYPGPHACLSSKETLDSETMLITKDPSKLFSSIGYVRDRENCSSVDGYVRSYVRSYVRFAASPGNGESSDRPFLPRCLVNSLFRLSLAQTKTDDLLNFSQIVRGESSIFAVCRFYLLIVCVCTILLPREGENGERKYKEVSKTSLRKYILLTLSHVEKTPERKKLSSECIISRLVKSFVCRSIIVSKEHHSSLGGLHYHVGIWNESASKHTATSVLRTAFPEFLVPFLFAASVSSATVFLLYFERPLQPPS